MNHTVAHIHSLMAEAATQGADLLIRSNLWVSILLKEVSACSWGSWGIGPVTFTGWPALTPEYSPKFSFKTIMCLHLTTQSPEWISARYVLTLTFSVIATKTSGEHLKCQYSSLCSQWRGQIWTYLWLAVMLTADISSWWLGFILVLSLWGWQQNARHVNSTHTSFQFCFFMK